MRTSTNDGVPVAAESEGVANVESIAFVQRSRSFVTATPSKETGRRRTGEP